MKVINISYLCEHENGFITMMLRIYQTLIKALRKKKERRTICWAEKHEWQPTKFILRSFIAIRRDVLRRISWLSHKILYLWAPWCRAIYSITTHTQKAVTHRVYKQLHARTHGHDKPASEARKKNTKTLSSHRAHKFNERVCLRFSRSFVTLFFFSFMCALLAIFFLTKYRDKISTAR